MNSREQWCDCVAPAPTSSVVLSDFFFGGCGVFGGRVAWLVSVYGRNARTGMQFFIRLAGWFVVFRLQFFAKVARRLYPRYSTAVCRLSSETCRLSSETCLPRHLRPRDSTSVWRLSGATCRLSGETCRAAAWVCDSNNMDHWRLFCAQGSLFLTLHFFILCRLKCF